MNRFIHVLSVVAQFLFYFFCVYGKPLFTIQSVKQMNIKTEPMLKLSHNLQLYCGSILSLVQFLSSFVFVYGDE